MGRKLAVASLFIMVIGAGIVYIAFLILFDGCSEMPIASCLNIFYILLIIGIIVAVSGLILFIRNRRDLPET